MRIVIDMQGAQTESRFRGIGRYTMSLAKAIVHNKGEHEIILALSGMLSESILPIRQAFCGLLPQEDIRVWYAPGPVRECDPENDQRREVAELIREVFLVSLQPDVVLVTSLFEGYLDDAVTSIGRFTTKIPTAAILYDLIPYLQQDLYLAPNPQYAKNYLQKIEYFQRADLWLAISDSAAEEGRDALSLAPDRVINISTACDEIFYKREVPLADAENFLARWQIQSNFIMYSGGADTRKNLHRLVDAYAQLPVDTRSKHQLVLAGKMPEGNVQELRLFAHSKGIEKGKVIFTGYVTDEELATLYSLCEVFVFPSLHEGFGLPALEAMTCGAPTIGSNCTSVPEVIGNPDALFDPYKTESIYNKLQELIRDKGFRVQLAEEALVQSKSFSWSNSANRALKTIEKYCPQNITKIYTRSLLQKLIMSIAEVMFVANSTEIANIAASIDKSFSQKTTDSPLIWRLEGPFDSSYSLALVNRELARALLKLGHTVVLHSTEGPGDFTPDEKFLSENSDIAKMHERSAAIFQNECDVTSRNLYPPRVEDMACNLNLLHSYGWEESGFPNEWVKSFNANLNGLTVMSAHVEKILIDNGVSVPISISGIGTDHWVRFPSDTHYLIHAKKFRFLHVSSCFPRKGVDVMLEAYGRVFTGHDDVSLVVKTFPNPHNTIQQQIAEHKQASKNYPDIVLIQDDLTESQLKSLYEQCQVLVAPSLAEGYGLPLAEAMLSGLPVITTSWSGQLDFCNSDNSWLIDYDFERASTHFNLYASVWAIPKVAELADAMRAAFSASEQERSRKAQLGTELLMQKHTWRSVAERSVDFVKMLNMGRLTNSKSKVGWVTTWNSKCGIATYSQHLSSDFPQDKLLILAPKNEDAISQDGSNCARKWLIGKENNSFGELQRTIDLEGIDCIIIQFNYGFFNHRELTDFINVNHNQGRAVIIMMHSTVDPIGKEPDWNFKLGMMTETLKKCDRVLVHTVHDLNRLKEIGVYKNTALFPHGVLSYDSQKGSSKVKQYKQIPIVASYGFCLPHKGLRELVEASDLLKTMGHPIQLLLVNAEYPSPESSALVAELRDLISSKNLSDFVTMVNDFLPESECMQYLFSSDLIVYPYQETGESSSAAVRNGLATGVPVAVTPVPIFEDVKGVVFELPGTNFRSIAEGIKTALLEIESNSDKAKKMNLAVSQWREQHNYNALSLRLYSICTALSRDNVAKL